MEPQSDRLPSDLLGDGPALFTSPQSTQSLPLAFLPIQLSIQDQGKHTIFCKISVVEMFYSHPTLTFYRDSVYLVLPVLPRRQERKLYRHNFHVAVRAVTCHIKASVDSWCGLDGKDVRDTRLLLDASDVFTGFCNTQLQLLE